MLSSRGNSRVLVDDRPGDPHGGIPGPPTDAAGDGPPLSIGLVSPVWPPDAYPIGIVSYVAALAEGLRTLGHRVTILTPAPAPGDWGDEVHDLGRGVAGRGLRHRVADWLWYRFAPEAAIQARFGRALAKAIGRAVAGRGIEVLEMEETFGWAGQVRRAIRIPLSVRLHGPWFLVGPAGGEGADGTSRRRIAREGRAIRLAAAVTAPSRDVLERTRAHYGLALERAEVIPNPTHPVGSAARWSPGGCTPGTVLFVGRFDYLKGGDVIIEAFERVLRAVPGARLDFVGRDHGIPGRDGRPWDLERFVDDRLPGARASGRVRLLGQVPHSGLAPLRREAMVSVVCSRYEVFGLALAEAMALGCPVVAARVGGIPEVVRDGVDGLLHRAGDPDDLAAKILALLGDPARAAEMGRRAAARCEQEFDPVAVAARMAAHYRRLREPIATSTPAR
jgi:glycosyltransferase involved in cell wall biosynthesis